MKTIKPISHFSAQAVLMRFLKVWGISFTCCIGFTHSGRCGPKKTIAPYKKKQVIGTPFIQMKIRSMAVPFRSFIDYEVKYGLDNGGEMMVAANPMKGELILFHAASNDESSRAELGRKLMAFRFNGRGAKVFPNRIFKLKKSILDVQGIGFSNNKNPCLIRDGVGYQVQRSKKSVSTVTIIKETMCKTGFQNSIPLSKIELMGGDKLEYARTYDAMMKKGLLNEFSEWLEYSFRIPNTGYQFVTSCWRKEALEVHDCQISQITLLRISDHKPVANLRFPGENWNRIWQVAPNKFWVMMSPAFPNGEGGLMGILDVKGLEN